MTKKLLSEIEVEELYGINRHTQRKERSKRTIPFIKINRRVYYSPMALEDWIHAHEVKVKTAK